MGNNPLAPFPMKTFKQRKRRAKARKREREKSVWRFMGMNHVCPNSKRPHNRFYYIYDDVSKRYLCDFCSVSSKHSFEFELLNYEKITVTPFVSMAKKIPQNFLADREIAYLKGKGGAWRAIRA